jgi:signal peptidase I
MVKLTGQEKLGAIKKSIGKNGTREEQARKNVVTIIKSFENAKLRGNFNPKRTCFLIGDDWHRSVDSRYYGPVNEKKIIGKVLGYVK